MTLPGKDAAWSTFITGALTVLALAPDRLIILRRNRRVEGGRDNPFGRASTPIIRASEKITSTDAI
jgi:hypothetical protein